MPIIKNRSQNVQVMRHFSTKLAIESVLGRAVNTTSSAIDTPSGSQRTPDPKPVVGSCHICYTDEIKTRRKTRKSCYECGKPVCTAVPGY